ncbi:MAG: NAD(P)H-binding protein [Lewinella sp.]|nr:NAD(P)H-binding protein [Lewinella sp.]
MNSQMMNILVVGASGATGQHMVNQLLERGQRVRILVRNPEKLPPAWHEREGLTISPGSLLDLNDQEMKDLVEGCAAIASCLGHNMTPKGIWGSPRRLVTEAVRRLCEAITSDPDQPVKFVLMNTVGNRNRDQHEPSSLGQRLVIGLMRLLLPPQRDNEQAPEYLRVHIGQDNPRIEWVAVRPDSLLDENEVSAYDIHPSPIRSPIFDPGKTSRINVAHFMSELMTNEALWQQWRGRMPVIYNREA